MDSSSTDSRREPFYAICLIILTTILTYGTMLSQLGFYRDDWYLLWTAESEGATGLLNLFRGDRPFLGWLYIFDFSMLGVSPFGWHLYALIIKIISALAFFWLVRSIWPQRKIETTFITLLFVIYPGFYQQANALTFKQLLLAYTAALFSLALTVQAVKTNKTVYKVLFTILAVALAAFYVFIYEALIGLEIARFFLIWYLLYKQNTKWRESLRSAMLYYIPYLSFAALFVFWRIFIFQSIRNATNVEVLADSYTSLHGLIRLVVETGKDLMETSILAWGVPFYQFSARAIYKDMGLALGLGLLVALAAAGYYLLARKQAEVRKDADFESSLDWLILGAIIIFVTTLPVTVAGRDVVFGVQWDRYTYQSVLGVAFLVGGFVFYALRGNLRWIVLALLLISGVSTQVFSEMFYRNFWEAQREAWWQLYWRAPQIEDGTTVIASLPGGYQFAEEYEVWGPLNLVYHRGEPLTIPGQVGLKQLAIDLEQGTIEERLVRGTVMVNRDYNYSIVTSMPSAASCLHVYNGSLLDISTVESSNIALLAPYSKMDLIDTDAASPDAPTQIMGDEPEHGWCYFYQKINLALQMGDWAGAARLADEARLADVQPQDEAEWLPVLEAYANVGDEKKAKRVSTFITDRDTRLYLCQQLKKTAEWPDGYRSDTILKVLCNVN
jgi:hypothetical protein